MEKEDEKWTGSKGIQRILYLIIIVLYEVILIWLQILVLIKFIIFNYTILYSTILYYMYKPKHNSMSLNS